MKFVKIADFEQLNLKFVCNSMRLALQCSHLRRSVYTVRVKPSLLG